MNKVSTNTEYFLIRNQPGQFIYGKYSSRGFVETPRYIIRKLARSLVKDMVDFAEIEIGSVFHKEIIDELNGVYIKVYRFDHRTGAMIGEPACPKMSIIDFCETFNMPDTADKFKSMMAQI